MPHSTSTQSAPEWERLGAGWWALRTAEFGTLVAIRKVGSRWRIALPGDDVRAPLRFARDLGIDAAMQEEARLAGVAPRADARAA